MQGADAHRGPHHRPFSDATFFLSLLLRTGWGLLHRSSLTPAHKGLSVCPSNPQQGPHGHRDSLGEEGPGCQTLLGPVELSVDGVASLGGGCGARGLGVRVRLAQDSLQAANAQTAPVTLVWSHSLTVSLSAFLSPPTCRSGTHFTLPGPFCERFQGLPLNPSPCLLLRRAIKLE